VCDVDYKHCLKAPGFPVHAIIRYSFAIVVLILGYMNKTDLIIVAIIGHVTLTRKYDKCVLAASGE